MRAAYLVGRFLLGGFFLYNGINHFKEREQLAQYAGSKGIQPADTAVVGSGTLLVASGMSLMLGAKPALGALGVIAFLLGVSPQMHDFWNVQDPQQRQSEMINFSKNMALAAAALALLGAEAGRE